MRRDGHTGSTELAALLGITIVSSLFVSYPQTVVQHSAAAAWMMVGLSVIPALLGWWATARILILYPGRGYPYILEDLLGPWLGTAVVVLIVVLWWVIMGLTLREFTDVIATVVLPNTPISATALMLMAAALYASYWGVEVIARVAWLLLPWLLLPLLLLLIGTAHWWDVNNLLPWLGTGAGQVGLSSLKSSGYFGAVMLLAFLAPRLRKVSDVTQTGYRALLGSMFITLLALVTYLLAWPLPAAVRIRFPLIKLARLVWVSRFVQRLESLYIFIWVAVIILFLALILYAVASALAQLLRLPNFRPLLFPQGVMVFAVTFWPEQLMQACDLETGVLCPLKIAFAYGLPLLLYPIACWRYKRGKIRA